MHTPRLPPEAALTGEPGVAGTDGDRPEDLTLRLRRLEGQIRGLQSMLAEGRECSDVLTQFLAVRSALDEIGARIVDAEVRRCLAAQPPQSDRLSDVMRLWLRLSH